MDGNGWLILGHRTNEEVVFSLTDGTQIRLKGRFDGQKIFKYAIKAPKGVQIRRERREVGDETPAAA